MACWNGDRKVERIKKQIKNYIFFINYLEGKVLMIKLDFKILIIKRF